MKNITYNDDRSIVCPVCKQILIQDPDDNGKGEVEINFCKHILLWYNDSLTEMLCVHKSLRAFVKELNSLAYKNEGDEMDAFPVIEKIIGKDNCIGHKYSNVDDGDYCSGYSDFLLFKK
jgi:uncharacterized protein YbaR (Trm112 family)